MTYDEKIQALLARSARKDELKPMLQSLYVRQKELRVHLGELEEDRQRQEKDVEQLEGFSLNSLFSRISGTREKKLEKERAEADAAVLSHELAAAQLADLDNEISDLENELAKSRNIDREYRVLLDEKLAAILASPLPEQNEIQDLADQLNKEKIRRDQLQDSQFIITRAQTLCKSAFEITVSASIGPKKSITTTFMEELHDQQSMVQNLYLAIAEVEKAIEECNKLPFFIASKVSLPPRIEYQDHFYGFLIIGSSLEKYLLAFDLLMPFLGKQLEQSAAVCKKLQAELDERILGIPM